MLELTEDQVDEVVSIEQSMNDCRAEYLEALQQYNNAVRDAFMDVEGARQDYLNACEKAEECRDSIAKDLTRRLKKVPKKDLKTPEGIQLQRWVEAWEEMDLCSEDMPDEPEEMDELDFVALNRFAKIPFQAVQFA